MAEGKRVVRVRMFAALREAAGAGEVDVEASTLQSLLETLRARYGPTFAERLAVASVLVDGDPVAHGRDLDLTDAMEVALLPPVSGGSQRPAPNGGGPVLDPVQRHTRQLVAAVVVLALLGVTMFAGSSVFTAAVVLLAVLVLVDLSAVFTRIGARPVAPAAALLAIGGPLLVAVDPERAWERLPALLTAAVIASFALVILFGRRNGVISALGATVAVGLLAGFGGAALLLLRAHLPGVELLGGYLGLVAAAELLGPPPGQRPPAPADPLRRSGPLAVGVIFVAAALLLWSEVFTFAVAPALAAVVIVAAVAGRRVLWGLMAAADTHRSASGRAVPGAGWASASAATVLLGAPLAYAVVRLVG